MDGVLVATIREAFRKFPRVITGLVDLCCRKGLFPEIWKEERLVLIPKRADGPRSGHRLICVLSNWSKVLESVIREKLLGQLKRETTSSKSVRVQGLSTVHALRELRNQHCMLVIVDVRNAFNSLEWGIIIRELKVRNCAKGGTGSHQQLLKRKESDGRNHQRDGNCSGLR